MEETLFTRAAVRRELLEHFVEARLHYDHETKGPAQIELQKRMIGHTGNPEFAIVDPETGEILRRRGFTADEAEWLKFLRGE